MPFTSSARERNSPVHIATYLDDALFGQASTPVGRRIRLAAHLALYAVGLVLWAAFFGFGHVSFGVGDWVWQNAALRVTRQTLLRGVMPWQVMSPSGALADPDQARFLTSIVTMTPDVMLLWLVPTATFIIVHVMAWYSIGYVASMRLLRRARANFATFSLFWLLFNFSGFISAHLSIGHFEYTGYFLFPAIVSLCLQLSADREGGSWRPDVATALLLGLAIGLLVLNGSVHFAVWTCALLVLMAMWRWRLVSSVLVAIASGVALGICRLVPAELFVPSPGVFVSGIPNPKVLLEGLTLIRIPDYNYVLGGTWGVLWWWEYDFFVGIVALVLIVVASAYALRKHAPRDVSPLLFASAVLGVLAQWDLYAYVRRVFPAIAGSERVSSRLMIVGFVVVLYLMAHGVMLAFERWPRATKIGWAASMVAVSWQLLDHAKYWTVAAIEHYLQADPSPTVTLLAPYNPKFTPIVAGSWALSAVALVVCVALLMRAQRRATPNAGSADA